MQRPRVLRLAASALLAGLLLVPGAALAADHTADSNSPERACDGYLYYFRITGNAVYDGTYDASDNEVLTNWMGQVVTVTNAAEDGQAFDWASTKTAHVVIAKEGNAGGTYTAGLPGKSGSIDDQTPQALSTVTWCGNGEPAPTPTPTPTVAPTPSGSVGGATDRPVITPPPTDQAFTSAAPSTGSFQVLAGIVALGLALVIALTPARRRR